MVSKQRTKLRKEEEQPPAEMASETDEDVAESTADSPKAGPIRRGKKGKKFASHDTMLSLIDSVTTKLESQITTKLQKTAARVAKAQQREHKGTQKKLDKEQKLKDVMQGIKLRKKLAKRSSASELSLTEKAEKNEFKKRNREDVDKPKTKKKRVSFA